LGEKERPVITIIDLGISNIKSITRGFVTQGFRVRITDDPARVEKATSLVLPGVGAFPKAVQILRDKRLLDPVIGHARGGKPLIGICLGMQLLFTDSTEHGFNPGLNLIPGHVVRFPKDRPVPHMGWNEVVQNKPGPLFQGVAEKADFYFVHSYYVKPDDEQNEIAFSDHCGRFAAAVQRGNIFGVQFHPEKSQRNGLLLLKNFALFTEREQVG
jgi:glutamine amidotransferase